MPKLGYERAYQRRLAGLRDGPPVPCSHCQRREATTLDHYPPLAMHAHREGTGCCRLIPSCEQCNRQGGQLVQQGRWRANGSVAEVHEDPERTGIPPDDKRWRVPWVSRLLMRMPDDAVWPRLMTLPHPQAKGSLGPEFADFAEKRSGKALRWWQELVATRLLETDAKGQLLWEVAFVSTARQVGKSWLLRELCLWRIHQSGRFGEPQDVLHTGKDVAVCKEIQRPARAWAKGLKELYRVREVNGQEEIEWVADGSRWMLRAKEAVYGYSASLAVVDEAWKVKAASVNEALLPTMVERSQPQLVLTSTAHRSSTSLMLENRALALDQLESGDGPLIIEWSAPPQSDPADVAAWRAASPHWSERREKMINGRHNAATAGETGDPDEADPVQSFRCQWLNMWPRRRLEPQGPTEQLLDPDLWAQLYTPGLQIQGPLYVAAEDDFGYGAGVACAQRLEDGRLELGGWLCPHWDQAVADIVGLRSQQSVKRVCVGASLLDRLPAELRPVSQPRASMATRVGLALLRDLALTGRVVHDVTPELDDAINKAHVRESPQGLFLVNRGPVHLVKAAVWALAEAHRPTKAPVIH